MRLPYVNISPLKGFDFSSFLRSQEYRRKGLYLFSIFLPHMNDEFWANYANGLRHQNCTFRFLGYNGTIIVLHY